MTVGSSVSVLYGLRLRARVGVRAAVRVGRSVRPRWGMMRRVFTLIYSPRFVAACVVATALALSPAVRPQATNPSPASLPASRPSATLATQLPPDTAIYFELRQVPWLSGGGTGGSVASAAYAIFKSATSSAPAETAPAAADSSPRQLFAAAVGLDASSKAMHMLFSGPVAIAADGWSGLSDAVLLAWPTDPAALEAELATHRVGEISLAAPRRYALANRHEIACDGRTAVVGRAKPRSLFARTVELLASGGESLASTAEFRERTANISRDAQILAYIGKSRSGGVEGQNPLTAWWPEDWPRIKTLALGLVWEAGGAYVSCSARLDPTGPPLARGEPPVQVLRRLPETVVAGWTQALDYVADFRRMRNRLALEPDGFHFDALENGLEPGIIENRILGHLVGDTVVVIDQVVVTPKDAAEQTETLILPVAGLLVETDDPDAVAAALPLVADNLVKLFNSQAAPEAAISVHAEPLAPGGPTIYTIPLGVAQAGKTKCDLLQCLELSWTVADRWLVLASHSQTVRRLVEARRGAASPLAIGDLDKVVEQVVERGGQPRRVLFAHPRSGANMVQTWIQHISKHHPEMLQAQWWDRLMRRQRATGKQVGILARPDHGVVEVVDALPGGPARGRLLPGDRILAVDGNKIVPESPLQSIRELVAAREQPSKVMFLIRRGDKEQEIELPMPLEEIEGGLRSPVELLKRASEVCRLFGSASYVLWQPRPDVVDARIDFRYLAAAKPVPASKPAPSPASQSAATQSAAVQPPATQPATTPAPPASAPSTAPSATTAPASQPMAPATQSARAAR